MTSISSAASAWSFWLQGSARMLVVETNAKIRSFQLCIVLKLVRRSRIFGPMPTVSLLPPVHCYEITLESHHNNLSHNAISYGGGVCVEIWLEQSSICLPLSWDWRVCRRPRLPRITTMFPKSGPAVSTASGTTASRSRGCWGRPWRRISRWLPGTT